MAQLLKIGKASCLVYELVIMIHLKHFGITWILMLLCFCQMTLENLTMNPVTKLIRLQSCRPRSQEY